MSETNVMLNHNIRVEIERNAMKPFYDRRNALEEREHALCHRVYNKLVSADLRSLLATVERHDNRFLYKATQFRFNVGGQTIDMWTGKDPMISCNHTMGGRGWLPGSLDYTKDAHRPLIDDVRKLQGDWETYKAERATAERTLRALLKGVRSTKSLFSVWPEGRKHYSVPPLVPVVRCGVPAVQVAALNEMLGLVKKKAA